MKIDMENTRVMLEKCELFFNSAQMAIGCARPRSNCKCPTMSTTLWYTNPLLSGESLAEQQEPLSAGPATSTFAASPFLRKHAARVTSGSGVSSSLSSPSPVSAGAAARFDAPPTHLHTNGLFSVTEGSAVAVDADGAFNGLEESCRACDQASCCLEVAVASF